MRDVEPREAHTWSQGQRGDPAGFYTQPAANTDAHALEVAQCLTTFHRELKRLVRRRRRAARRAKWIEMQEEGSGSSDEVRRCPLKAMPAIATSDPGGHVIAPPPIPPATRYPVTRTSRFREARDPAEDPGPRSSPFIVEGPCPCGAMVRHDMRCLASNFEPLAPLELLDVQIAHVSEGSPCTRIG